MIGQNHIRTDLGIQLASSIKTHNPLEPVFFGGLSGNGKTTIAEWLADEIRALTKESVDMHVCAGSEFKSDDDVYDFARDWGNERYKIRMVDEAHMLRKNLAGVFTFLFDHNLQGKSVAGEIHRPCIFIFCSEFEERIQYSLRTRFTHMYKLAPYTIQELASVINYHIFDRPTNLKNKYCFRGSIRQDAITYIAERSRHNARCAVNHITRIIKEANKTLNVALVKQNFLRNHVGELGLDQQESILLYHLFIKTTRGEAGNTNKPISLPRLADQLSFNKDQIQLIYEPFLNAEGLLEVVTGGRTLSVKGINFVRERREYFKAIYEEWKPPDNILQ